MQDAESKYCVLKDEIKKLHKKNKKTQNTKYCCIIL